MERRRNYWLLLLVSVIVAISVKLVDSSEKFKVTLEYYRELRGDTATKCIKLCVTTSLTGIPRCNLNTTTGNSKVAITNTKNYPHPYIYHYDFKHWEDNSELSATVWKLPLGETCDSSSPTNTTTHGSAVRTIPRHTTTRTLYLKDTNNTWDMLVQTKITCSTANCLPACAPHDDSTGHYTCKADGNKQCLPNWYGSDCLKLCVPRNDSLGHYSCTQFGEQECLQDWYGGTNCTIFCDSNAQNYNCTDNGTRICNNGWFGENCEIFCNRSASNYVCLANGRRICSPNWYNQKCDAYCDNSVSSYKCDDNGVKICTHNWYGLDCATFCNNTESRYKCAHDGNIICMPNWFGENCTKFCNNSESRYRCNQDGSMVCLSNWYGQHCSRFCNNSEMRYKCDKDGNILCLPNFYGVNCSRFCDTNNPTYKCNGNGERICLRDWYGTNCSDFCNNSSPTYRCNHQGLKICHRNWYGKNCSIFCNDSASDYRCDETGNRIGLSDWYGKNCSTFCKNDTQPIKCADSKPKCQVHWYGESCSKFCNGTANLNYNCDSDGNKICLAEWYGPECSKHCDSFAGNYRCTTKGEKECFPHWYGSDCEVNCYQLETVSDLYLCTGKEDSNVICPQHWLTRECSKQCITSEGNDLDYFLKLCNSNLDTKRLCSRNATNDERCADASLGSLQSKRKKIDSSAIILGGLFGSLALIVIITTIVIVYISTKKQKHAASPTHDTQSTAGSDLREFNRAELTLNIDELLRNRDAEEELDSAYDNPCMMIENPLFRTTRAPCCSQSDTHPCAIDDTLSMAGSEPEFKRAEVTLSIDELLRNRKAEDDVDGIYENAGMMAHNPLYERTRALRATLPF